MKRKHEKSKQKATPSCNLESRANKNKKNDDSAATIWLFLWCFNNIAVTLFSRVEFRHPYLMASSGMFISSIGSFFIVGVAESYERVKRSLSSDSLTEDVESFALYMKDTREKKISPIVGLQSNIGKVITKLLGDIKRKPLDKTTNKIQILIISLLFSLQIIVEKISLEHVSMNFNQVMLSLVPVATMAVEILLGKTISLPRVLAIFSVIIGVAFACYGDMYYETTGLIYEVLSIFLIAARTIVAGEMLSGSISIHPVDLLSRIAPLAFMQLLTFSALTGEMAFAISRSTTSFWDLCLAIAGGILQFSLNIEYLQASKLTSPLTLCIAGNVKQVLLVGLATFIFSTPLTAMNATGIFTALFGSVAYSYFSAAEK